ncbi:MAG: anti-sigma B factor antagonist [Myxococcota bacterium]|jgi:anti-sigma B factor antagonist
MGIPLTIESRVEGDVGIVILTGHLDTTTSVPAEAALVALIESAAVAHVVDLSGVSFVASSGLRVLLKTVKALKRRKCKLHLAGMTPGVHEVFTVSGFMAFFRVHGSLDDALESLGSS